MIIPLTSDMAFFQVLAKALQSTSDQLIAAQEEFTQTLGQLSRNVSLTARPISSTSSFHPHSAVSQQSAVKATSFGFGAKSDLYTWRELFQLYVDSEVFESVSESHRGERTVEDAEARLQAFTARVTTRGLAKKLKLKPSHAALEMFMELNIFILNVKKVSACQGRGCAEKLTGWLGSFNAGTQRPRGRFSRSMRSVRRFRFRHRSTATRSPCCRGRPPPFRGFWFKPWERRCSPSSHMWTIMRV